MQAVAHLTASYAKRSHLIDALGDGDPAGVQGDEIDRPLGELYAAQAGIGGAFHRHHLLQGLAPRCSGTGYGAIFRGARRRA
jgi:hypothetical protein